MCYFFFRNEELRKQLEDYQNKVDKLNGLLAEHEVETVTLRRQLESLAKERDNWKKEALSLREDNNRLRCVGFMHKYILYFTSVYLVTNNSQNNVLGACLQVSIHLK